MQEKYNAICIVVKQSSSNMKTKDFLVLSHCSTPLNENSGSTTTYPFIIDVIDAQVFEASIDHIDMVAAFIMFDGNFIISDFEFGSSTQW